MIVKADPLLVWSFATLDAEKTVSYEISKFLDENCRRDLKATAAVNVIVENGIEKPPVLAFPQRFNPENPNLLIENPDLILVSGEFKNIEIKENEIKTTETPLGQPDEIELGDDIDFMDANFEIEINPNPQCRIKTGARRTVLCEKGFKIKDIKVKKKGTGALHRRHEFEEGENERPEIENVDVSPLNRLTGADVGTERQVAINIKISDETPLNALIYDVKSNKDLLKSCRYDKATQEIFCTIKEKRNDNVEITLEVTDSGGKKAVKKFDVVVNFPP